ncbi:hypothetical protein LCGC14_2030670 [marine sediment metagenome]|uniref:Uncharacterized protein n=1 Tax=marine sediment metagenome TaxID=412755 RepID=A0A0F9HRV8_9ZZZZ
MTIKKLNAQYHNVIIEGGRAFTWKTIKNTKTYILYNSGVCRIDDHIKFTTLYYTGLDRIKWWELFKKNHQINVDKTIKEQTKQINKAKRLFASKYAIKISYL